MFSTQGTRLTTRIFASLTLAGGLFVGACSDPASSVVEPRLAAQAQGAELFPASTSSLQAQTTLAIGGSKQMVLSSPFVSWRRNVYRSRNANVATVSSGGLIRGVANGRTYVVVSYNTSIDSSLVVVGSGNTLSVQPAVATIPIGSTQQLSVTGGSNVTYSVETGSVASISPTGLLTALGAGSTLVAATSAGAHVNMTVTVPMAFSTPNLSVVLGSTAQIALGALSVPCANGARTYSSAAPSVATVSSTGVVTGVAVGTTTVTVGAGLCSGTLPITVTTASSGGPVSVPANAVAVNLQHFSGPAGAVSFSNGIPLPPGLVLPSALGNVTLFLGGIEQPLFVRALGGLHPDGSLRAIQIQGRVVAGAAGSSIQGYMMFNTPRTAGTLAQAASPTTLEAAVLPTSAAFLVSTNVSGPMLTAAQVRGSQGTPNIVSHDVDFETMAPQIFAKTSMQFSRGVAVYEHLLSHYQHFMQTADPKWYQMAWQMGEVYRAYGEANYAPEWNITTEGLAVHYWFTGDERARAVVGKMTEWLTGTVQYIYRLDVADGGYRLKGRALIGALDCVMIQCNPGKDGYLAPYNLPYDLPKIIPTQYPKVLGTQAASGLFPGTLYAGGQKNYMVGILLEAMIRKYDEYGADPAILAAVKKSLDYMWTTQWMASGNGFKYCSTTYGDCNTGTELGLNNMILPAYAWYYSKTKDVAYLQMADQIFAGNRLRRPDWLGFPQQFDQAMYRVANYYAWRQ